MIVLTKPQRQALYRVYLRDNAATSTPASYRKFRDQVRPGPGCIMIHWQGMWLGIEPDGYTHS